MQLARAPQCLFAIGCWSNVGRVKRGAPGRSQAAYAGDAIASVSRSRTLGCLDNPAMNALRNGVLNAPQESVPVGPTVRAGEGAHMSPIERNDVDAPLPSRM